MRRTYPILFETAEHMGPWSQLDRRLVLASNSARRREILEKLGFAFSVYPPKVEDEARFFGQAGFGSSARALALAKARSVACDTSDALVFAADTVVCIGTRVMGKPGSRNEARDMLSALSGAVHDVYTGVALVCDTTGFAVTGVARTAVWFRELTDSEIEEYLDAGEYADKAGAYAIQGKATAFVDKIDGCFYNVVGLPVSKTIRLFMAYRQRKDVDHA